jgi:cell division protein ZapE
MTPLNRYQSDLNSQGFVADPAQENAVHHTQRLYEELLADPGPPGLLQRLRGRHPKHQRQRGLYFWGGVGRGKTYLVDNFFACLPFEEKQRLHFHRFMRNVHDDLRKLKKTKNPLSVIAAEWAQKARVLCLDEFHVNDIADAMLLSGLLHALLDEGVTLLGTSNVPPSGLYKNGLQRDSFLPAIDLLETHLEVVNVDGGVDYRLRALEQAPVYFQPLSAETEQLMRAAFERLAPDEAQYGVMLNINNREFPSIASADGVVWLDFQVLCNIPRSTDDYIEIAQCFNTVLLGNVDFLGENQDDFVRRLINLVDEFYDRNVKLIVSAAADPEALYTGERQQFEFRRTVSRLREMRSHEYLQRPHLP